MRDLPRASTSTPSLPALRDKGPPSHDLRPAVTVPASRATHRNCGSVSPAARRVSGVTEHEPGTLEQERAASKSRAGGPESVDYGHPPSQAPSRGQLPCQTLESPTRVSSLAS